MRTRTYQQVLHALADYMTRVQTLRRELDAVQAFAERLEVETVVGELARERHLEQWIRLTSRHSVTIDFDRMGVMLRLWDSLESPNKALFVTVGFLKQVLEAANAHAALLLGVAP